jgi:hypothetical protein
MAFWSVELGFCVWASGSFLGAVCGLRAICLLRRVGLAGFFVSDPVYRLLIVMYLAKRTLQKTESERELNYYVMFDDGGVSKENRKPRPAVGPGWSSDFP